MTEPLPLSFPSNSLQSTAALLLAIDPAANERPIPRYPVRFNVKDFGAKGDGEAGVQRQVAPAGLPTTTCMSAAAGWSQCPSFGSARMQCTALTSLLLLPLLCAFAFVLCLQAAHTQVLCCGCGCCCCLAADDTAATTAAIQAACEAAALLTTVPCGRTRRCPVSSPVGQSGSQPAGQSAGLPASSLPASQPASWTACQAATPA